MSELNKIPSKAKAGTVAKAKSLTAKSECNRPYHQPSNQPGIGSNAKNHQTDPAILIGLAMAFGKNGGVNVVPGIILEPLDAAAQHGCGASHMVLAWLERRAKPSGSAFTSPAALAVQNSTRPNGPSILGGHHG
jgi:hypothetical protein